MKIGKKERKMKILQEIDQAMLDIKRQKILRQEIKKGLKDFELKIPRTFEGTGELGIYFIKAW